MERTPKADREPAIVPEPDEAIRAAILRALAPSEPPAQGWAEAAVSAHVPAALHQHDVCSLW